MVRKAARAWGVAVGGAFFLPEADRPCGRRWLPGVWRRERRKLDTGSADAALGVASRGRLSRAMVQIEWVMKTGKP